MAISVDVPHGNVDKAWRSLTRKVRDEQYMASAQGRQYYMKPSERRKLAASASEKKMRKQHFRCVRHRLLLGPMGCGCGIASGPLAARPASLRWASNRFHLPACPACLPWGAGRCCNGLCGARAEASEQRCNHTPPPHNIVSLCPSLSRLLSFTKLCLLCLRHSCARLAIAFFSQLLLALHGFPVHH